MHLIEVVELLTKMFEKAGTKILCATEGQILLLVTNNDNDSCL